jgi:hypothetical protein
VTWIILVITINGNVMGSIPYRNETGCGDALPSIHATLSSEHRDVMLQCRDSGVPKMRPKARNEGQ